jgi:hypothetical protein
MDNDADWARKYITHGIIWNPDNDNKYNYYYNQNKHCDE